MKKLALLIFAFAFSVFMSNTVSAQGKYGADSAECLKYLSYYKEYYKQKNYEDALPNWRKAYALCPPTCMYTLLSDGTTLLRRQISKTTTSAEYKELLIDSLMTLYKQRVELWPKYRTASLNNQALDMYNYMKDRPVDLYNGLSEIIALNKEKTKPNIFLFHFNTACELYQEGKLEAEMILKHYDIAVETLESIVPKNDIEAKLIAKTMEDVQSIFIQSNVANCEDVINLFTPRFEAAPTDLNLAKNIVRMLQVTEGCSDNDLYLNAVNVIYANEPSHTSAYYLFRLYASKGDIENAEKYITEAISSDDSDPDTDAEYYYNFAKFCADNGQNSKAYQAATSAVELSDLYDGKAYYLIGSIWANTPCGGNEISSRAKFWVATDFMIKARNADPSLTEDANRAIGQYSAYYPKTEDAFMYNLQRGQGYTVSCGGMRSSTTVRTR